MKIVYLFTHDIVKHAGVTKKVLSQTDAWKNLGHDVRIFNIILKKEYLYNKSILHANIYYRVNIIKGPESLLNDMESFSPDIVYMRFELYKPFLGKILKKFNTVIELNTDDYSELKFAAKRNKNELYRYVYYNFTKHLIYKNVKGFVTVTSEIKELHYLTKHKKKIKVIPNSIYLENYNILKTKKKNNIPQIIFMGNLNSEWNGMDKILKLAEKTIDKLFFHIIGLTGNYSTKLKNVKLYGYLVREKYIDIISKGDIGLGTLALHRKGMNEACPLKVREYLAYGLPIIIGYNETVFFNIQKPKWVLQLPNNEENVIENYNKIVDFCYREKDTIVHHNEIRSLIDSLEVEKKKIDFFNKICGQ